MSNYQTIAVCFFRQDFGESYYNRGQDLFYQGIKFPKGSKYEGYEFFVQELSIQSNSHCKEDDPNRSFNPDKMWVYLVHGYHCDVQNIETRETIKVLSDEIKEEMERQEYDRLKEIPSNIREKYNDDYEAILNKFFPKYKIGQMVMFRNSGEIEIGKISIVDIFGTIEQNEEPSYDIEDGSKNVLYKHIRQSNIIKTME